ncbi:MAG: Cof-type HAD-IIB family hydrolase [Jiangellaceae bacterium]
MTAPAPRLVATDLDGTLLRSDHSVSERSVSALRRAEQAGAIVVLVTGRPPRSMRPVADAVGHTGIAVCANGAVVYDLHADRVLETFLLDQATVAAVIEAVADALPDAYFGIETTANRLVDLEWRRGRIGLSEIGSEAIKLLVRHELLGPDELLAAARDVAGDLAEFTHSSKIGLLEISATGVTKASTLATVAAEHDIAAADVVAFGDMPNDLPMLAWAGRSYAMANAHTEVLAAVRSVAPANDDDGVAAVLEELFGVEPDSRAATTLREAASDGG